jgi:hypothetical protein
MIQAAREAEREAKRKNDAVVIENLLAEKKAKREAKQAKRKNDAENLLAEKKAKREAKQDHAAAERAAADARAAASKAMIEAERKEKATTVASRLDHAALMRDAERAAADARAAASKAMIEAERKEKVAAEATIEFERKSEAWDLAHQRVEAARTRMEAANAQIVDAKTYYDNALAEEHHSIAYLNFLQANVDEVSPSSERSPPLSLFSPIHFVQC